MNKLEIQSINYCSFEIFFFLKEQCEDFAADEGSCTKFVRCFGDIRVRFTCPSGTAWEDSLKTCVWTEEIETCQRAKQQRRLGLFVFSFR